MNFNKAVRIARLDRQPASSSLMQLVKEAQKNPNRRFQVDWPAPVQGSSIDTTVFFALTCVISAPKGLLASSAPRSHSQPEWTLSQETEQSTASQSQTGSHSMGQYVNQQATGQHSMQSQSQSSTILWSHTTGDIELVLNLVQSEVARHAPQSAPAPARLQQTDSAQHRFSDPSRQPSSLDSGSGPPQQTTVADIGQIMLAGDIANVELPSIFQSISICKMTGRLNLYYQTTQGEIYFNDGKIVHALLHSAMDIMVRLTPDQVVLELLTWTAGTFRFNPGWTTSDRTIERRLESFLMEGAALSDYQAALEKMGFSESETKVKKNTGYLDQALTEMLSAGVAVDLDLQKSLYNQLVNVAPISELIADLPRTVWIPAVFNLIKCGLFEIVTSDEGAHFELEPVQIDDALADNAAKSLSRPETGVMAAPFLFYFLRLEFSRHRKHQLPLSMVLVTLPADGFGPEVQQLKSCFDSMREDYERIAHYDMHQSRRFILILPYRNISSTYLFMLRLIARLDRCENIAAEKYQFAIASTPDDAGTLELMLAALLHAQKIGESTKRRITSYSGIELERWDTLRIEGEAAQKAGNLHGASETWLKGLAEAQEFNSDDARLVYTVDRLSAIHMTQRQFDTAEPLLKLACELKRERGQERELAASLGELGKCYFEQGQFENAEPALLESIAIFERNYGPQHELVGEGVHNLATLYHLQDKTESASQAYQKAITIKRNYLGRNHPETIKIAQNYTKLLKSQSVDNRTDVGYISGTWRALNFDPSDEFGTPQVEFST